MKTTPGDDYRGLTMACLHIVLLTLLVAGCRAADDEPAESATPGAPEQVEPAEPRVVEAPPVPASTRILGRFEYLGRHGDTEVRLGVAFDGETLVRSTGGVATSHQAYRVVDEAEDRVVLELQTDGQRTVQRTFVVLDDARLADDAAPDVVYTRVADEGSGETTATAPTSPPAPSAPR